MLYSSESGRLLGELNRVILFLFHFLVDCIGWKIPTVFTYSSTRMILAALTALLMTILLGPKVIKRLYELKTGQSIRVEDCPQLARLHEKKKDTPTMGGILILGSMLFSLLIWMDLHSPFTLILFITTIVLGLIGGFDDYLKMKHKNSKGMSPKKKLFGQLALALGIGAYLYFPAVAKSIECGNWFSPPTAKQFYQQLDSPVTHVQELSTEQYAGTYYAPFFKDPIFILSGSAVVIGLIFTSFIITGSSNGVNLTDGLDGLASGCLVMVASVFALFAFLSNNVQMCRYLNIMYIENSGEIAVYLCSLVGACLGFLWYNGYPAQIFMGDTGSLSLGGIIGVAAVLLRREMLLGIVGGIFVAETLSVILQVGSYKLRNKKRIFLCTPLHHHFEYKGWPETKVVVRFWIVSLILAIIGLASLKFQ